MMVDKNLGEVAGFLCSDGVAALARVHQEFKGSDYSFLDSICKGKSILFCVLLLLSTKESETLEKVQQKGSIMAGVL